MKSVEANEAGETMRVKLAAAEAERDALRAEVERLRGLLLGYYRLPSSEWIKSLKVEARASVEVKP